MIRRYWTTACPKCPLQSRCTTGPERRIPRWEHEHVLDAVQERLDASPEAMRMRRETVEHPFGTMKARMGATHFLMKTLPKVATEMALSVLAYNLTRVVNIVGVKPLLAAVGGIARASIVTQRPIARPQMPHSGSQMPMASLFASTVPKWRKRHHLTPCGSVFTRPRPEAEVSEFHKTYFAGVYQMGEV